MRNITSALLKILWILLSLQFKRDLDLKFSLLKNFKRRLLYALEIKLKITS